MVSQLSQRPTIIRRPLVACNKPGRWEFSVVFVVSAKRAIVSRFNHVDLAAGDFITPHCTISFRMHDLYDYDFAAPALMSICFSLFF